MGRGQQRPSNFVESSPRAKPITRLVANIVYFVDPPAPSPRVLPEASIHACTASRLGMYLSELGGSQATALPGVGGP